MKPGSGNAILLNRREALLLSDLVKGTLRGLVTSHQAGSKLP
jgi:hypothetical protein